MKYNYIVLLILFCPSIILAAPSVSGVSGTVSDGQSITISGSGFGATGPNVAFFDTLENATTGQPVPFTANSADVGNWGAPASRGGALSTVSTEYGHGGGKSLRVDWRYSYGGDYGAGPSIYFPNVQNTYVFFSWWQFLPNDRVIPGTNNPVDGPNLKYFWMGDRFDGWPMGSDYAGQQHYGFNEDGTTIGIQGPVPGHDEGLPLRYDSLYYSYSSLFLQGTWTRITMAMKNATAGGHIWQQEINGIAHRIQHDNQNVMTAHSDDPWNQIDLPGYGRADDNAVMYFDDIYIATGDGARARVEIGNQSTYSASTNLAIITPTSWSDTSIVATVRAGSFTSGQAYLFIIDASGVPNDLGYPITIGESAPNQLGGKMSAGGAIYSGGYMR